MPRTLLLGLSVCLVSGTLACAQVSWIVSPSPVPTGQQIKLVITNNSGGNITLPSTAPWSIHLPTPPGGLVFGPIGLAVLVGLPDKQSKSYTWDQQAGGRPVLPGTYEARIDYLDMNRKRITLAKLFQITSDQLTVSGTASPGGTVTLTLNSSSAPTLAYQVGLAFFTSPTLPIGGNRELELAPDALTVLSLLVGPPTFVGFSGSLDGQGTAKAAINIPNVGALKGVAFHAAYVTLAPAAPAGIFSYSAAKRIQIQ